MIGVNFQPGAQDYGNGQTSRGPSRPSSGSGVQEAIKILSLRLPKVVGAQAAVPMPLLTSQGSGGNSRVDSIVQQVMSRLPGGPPQSPQPQHAGPSFGEIAGPLYQTPPWQPPAGGGIFPMPNVVIGPGPGQTGTDADLSGGGPPPMGGGNGTPPGSIAPAPPMAPPSPTGPSPDILDELRRRFSAPPPSYEQPLF